MILLAYGLVFIVLCFGLVVFFGAPYLPTLDVQAEAALDMLDLKPGQHVIDLGSGDGTMLIRAARRGVYATGYELNPILYAISWLRTYPYRKLVTVHCQNYWLKQWPTADGIFVFLHTNFMQRLDKKLNQYAKKTPIRVVSFTFQIPGKKITKRDGGLFLYDYGR